MKKILGLDLGVNSLGWAVVSESDDPTKQSKIIDAGVRIVPLDVDEKTDFEKGKAITTNVNRRMKRGMRRNLQRYKLRREALKQILVTNNFIKEDEILSEQGNYSTFHTYEMRAKAVTEEIPLNDFARVLLMINKKRGYKSNRKTKSAEEGSSIDSMDLAITMYNNNLTPGEICYDMLQSGKKRLPDFYISDLTAEFQRIWDKQREYYPHMLTDKLMEEVISKTTKQTFAILSKAFIWTEEDKQYNATTGEFVKVETEQTIKGIKRAKKGLEQKLETASWRCQALNEKIHPEHLLIVLQEINSQINSSSGYLGKISDRSKTLYIEKKTVGQYLYERIQANCHNSLKNIVFYRQDYLDEFNAIWDKQAQYHPELTEELKREIRDVVIFYQRRLKSQKDLVGLCEFESHEIKVEKNGRTITKTIGRRAIPKSHPLFQDFRIWQTLNNVEVSLYVKRKRKKVEPTLFDETIDALELHGHRRLYVEEMAKLHKELSVKEQLTKTEVIKLLFDGRKDVELNFDKISGNRTMHSLYKAYSDIIEDYGYEPLDFKMSADDLQNQLEKIFSTNGWNTDIVKPFDSTDIKQMERHPNYRLWHLLYSYEGDNSNSGDKKLIERIMNDYGFSGTEANILASTAFEPEYGNLCAKAIGKILPYLKEGNTYDTSCAYAGYNHSKSITAEENAERILSPYLELVQKNSLRNPVVEKILNQMVNVVNAIIDEYGNRGESGPFDEIRVELARELKKNAKERADLSKAIKDNDAENQRIREIIKRDFNIQHISRNDIIRYKLYKELEPNGYKTLYSNQYIPYEKIFSKEIEIEHIIPQACLFDDSMSNKTLEYHSVNLAKGKLTAYDYVKGISDDALEEYEKRCRICYADRKGKLNKLLMSANDIPQDFIERDLRNTQYISRKALSMLSSICRSVVATTGTITDKLRKDWQLVDVMKEINTPKYAKLGLVTTYRTEEGNEIRNIDNWTKRNDHRHHAMDAITVAFTRRAIIQFYNNRNAQWDEESGKHDNIIAINKKYFRNGFAIPPMPLNDLRAEVIKHLNKILVSLKAKNKVVTISTNKVRTKNGIKETKQITPRGSLHKETVYGVRHRYIKKAETINASFDAEKINTVANAKYRIALIDRLQQYGGDAKKAFTGKNAPTKNPIYIDTERKHFVPAKVETVVLEEYYTLRSAITPKLSVDAVLDKAVRDALKQRLARFGNDPNKAFINLEEDPIILHGKPLKRVTIAAKVDKGMFIHEKRDKDGKLILDDYGEPINSDFVKASENHHAEIYRRPKLDSKGNQKLDKDGNPVYEWHEEIISFLEAVTLVNEGLPVVNKTWGADEGWEFVFSVKKNEYFVFPDKDGSFNPEEIDLLDPANAAEISPHLYRSQKFSKGDYYFRHHLETTVEDVVSLKDITWKRINPSLLQGVIKVRINHVGKIVAVGEY